MGTLGGDFLSSLPLHEYPPAFPLGADIQGRTPITRWAVPSTSAPKPDQNPCSFSKPSGSLARGFFVFCFVLLLAVKGSDRRLILVFLFLSGLDLFSFLQTESQVSGPCPHEDVRSLKRPF